MAPPQPQMVWSLGNFTGERLTKVVGTEGQNSCTVQPPGTPFDSFFPDVLEPINQDGDATLVLGVDHAEGAECNYEYLLSSVSAPCGAQLNHRGHMPSARPSRRHRHDLPCRH